MRPGKLERRRKLIARLRWLHPLPLIPTWGSPRWLTPERSKSSAGPLTRREKAHTPRGNFRVYRKAGGWETSPLGRLYKADHFHGGYAIHGEPEVPLYPASHGCVRTPMHTADIVAGLLTIGTPVYVRG